MQYYLYNCVLPLNNLAQKKCPLLIYVIYLRTVHAIYMYQWKCHSISDDIITYHIYDTIHANITSQLFHKYRRGSFSALL